MSFEVITDADMSKVVFWVVKTWTCRQTLTNEEGDSTFLRNFGIYLQDHDAIQSICPILTAEGKYFTFNVTQRRR